jgi:hypothetical protein
MYDALCCISSDPVSSRMVRFIVTVVRACKVQRARELFYCVSYVACCPGMLDAEVMRRAVCRAARGPLQLAFCMSAVLLLWPIACCILHAASLSLHSHRKLRIVRRTLHRAYGICLPSPSSAAFRSCAGFSRCCTTHARRRRDVRGCGNIHHKCDGGDRADSEGYFVRNAGSERRFRPVFDRL